MKALSTKKLALAGCSAPWPLWAACSASPFLAANAPGAAHGQHPVRCAAGPLLRHRRGFVASLLRNLLGLGSLMAFPGSMFGALLCGIVYHKTEKLLPTLVGEVFGTSILGGLCATRWPSC